MSGRFQNQTYLQKDQYNDAEKLAARIRLHKLYNTNPESIHRWSFDVLLSEAPKTGTIHLLECGCGRGDLWKENPERIPENWQITLTDFSEGMLADCQAFLGDDLTQKFSFKQMDIQSLPYEDNSMDVILANMMLYHVPDRPKAFAELRRVLKPGGVLLAMTNGDGHMREIFQLAGQFSDDPELYQTVFQLSFSLQNGKTQLEPYFDTIQIQRFDAGLHITEAQPILDYIASMMSVPGDGIVRNRGADLFAEIQARIARDSAIDVRKDTGMFIAR